MVACSCSVDHLDQNNDIYSGLGEDTSILPSRSAYQDKQGQKIGQDAKDKGLNTPQRSYHKPDPKDSHRENQEVGEIGLSGRQGASEETTEKSMHAVASNQVR